jgi:hypothetical protein
VVVTGPQLMGEVQGIPDAIMSFDRVVDEVRLFQALRCVEQKLSST